MSVRVLIVDDQYEFRALARELLVHRGYRVVGEAGSHAKAVTAAAELRPDAILLDVRLGDEDGFKVAADLRQTCPDAAVLLVSNADFTNCIELMQSTGARGFVLKDRLASTDLSSFWPEQPASAR